MTISSQTDYWPFPVPSIKNYNFFLNQSYCQAGMDVAVLTARYQHKLNLQAWSFFALASDICFLTNLQGVE